MHAPRRTRGSAAVISVVDRSERAARPGDRRLKFSRCVSGGDVESAAARRDEDFYAQGVEANVLFFDRKPAATTPWTTKLWVYEVKCFNPEHRNKRRSTWSEKNPTAAGAPTPSKNSSPATSRRRRCASMCGSLRVRMVEPHPSLQTPRPASSGSSGHCGTHVRPSAQSCDPRSQTEAQQLTSPQPK